MLRFRSTAYGRKETTVTLGIQLSVCPAHPGTTLEGATCPMCDLDEFADLLVRFEEIELDLGDVAAIEERIWVIEERLPAFFTLQPSIISEEAAIA